MVIVDDEINCDAKNATIVVIISIKLDACTISHIATSLASLATSESLIIFINDEITRTIWKCYLISAFRRILIVIKKIGSLVNTEECLGRIRW